VTQRQVISIS